MKMFGIDRSSMCSSWWSEVGAEVELYAASKSVITLRATDNLALALASLAEQDVEVVGLEVEEEGKVVEIPP